MGYAIVPDIGDEAVVCQSDCGHTDCAANRKEWANAKCSICGMAMVAGQNFYRDDKSTPQNPSHVHAGCLYDKVESEREQLLVKKGE